MQVGVHDDDGLAASMMQSRGRRHLVTKVPRQRHDANRGIVQRMSGENTAGAIGTAIVHEHHLVALSQGGEMRLESGVGQIEYRLLVQKWNDHTQHGRREGRRRSVG